MADLTPVTSGQIRRGYRGPLVMTLREMLAIAGFLPASSVSDALLFDGGVESLLRNFQAAKRLAIDGVAGPKTWNALVQIAGGSQITSPSTGPTPEALSAGVGAGTIAGLAALAVGGYWLWSKTRGGSAMSGLLSMFSAPEPYAKRSHRPEVHRPITHSTIEREIAARTAEIVEDMKEARRESGADRGDAQWREITKDFEKEIHDMREMLSRGGRGLPGSPATFVPVKIKVGARGSEGGSVTRSSSMRLGPAIEQPLTQARWGIDKVRMTQDAFEIDREAIEENLRESADAKLKRTRVVDSVTGETLWDYNPTALYRADPSTSRFRQRHAAEDREEKQMEIIAAKVAAQRREMDPEAMAVRVRETSEGDSDYYTEMNLLFEKYMSPTSRLREGASRKLVSYAHDLQASQVAMFLPYEARHALAQKILRGVQLREGVLATETPAVPRVQRAPRALPAGPRIKKPTKEEALLSRIRPTVRKRKVDGLDDVLTDSLIDEPALLALRGECTKAVKMLLHRRSLPQTDREWNHYMRVRDVVMDKGCGHVLKAALVEREEDHKEIEAMFPMRSTPLGRKSLKARAAAANRAMMSRMRRGELPPPTESEMQQIMVSPQSPEEELDLARDAAEIEAQMLFDVSTTKRKGGRPKDTAMRIRRGGKEYRVANSLIKGKRRRVLRAL